VPPMVRHFRRQHHTRTGRATPARHFGSAYSGGCVREPTCLRARTLGRHNVLSLSRSRPSRADHADTRTYEARGAEAPGQRTAASRLLRRVSRPLFRRLRFGRTCGNTCWPSWRKAHQAFWVKRLSFSQVCDERIEIVSHFIHQLLTKG